MTVYAHEVDASGASEYMVDGIRVVRTVGISGKSTSTLSHGLTASVHALRAKPDVVLAMNVANGYGLSMLRTRRIPFVLNVDGIEWERAKWGRLARSVFRGGAWAAAKWSTVLVVDALEIGRVWRSEFGVDSEFIPYGADIVEQGEGTALLERGIVPSTYVLVVARLAPENNVELLLDAMDLSNWDIPVVVVGSANYENPIEGRLRRLSESGRVSWLGHVSDQVFLSQLWANAGVYFHGHSVGGTNPALLQALGCGAPTIALDTAYNREVLGSDDQLAPPDASTIALAIHRVMGDYEERERLSAKGRAIVRERYRWEDVFSAYERVLVEAASR